MADSNESFLDNILGLARDALPYAAILGLVAATGGAATPVAAGGLTARFAATGIGTRFAASVGARTAIGPIGGFAANTLLRLNPSALAKAGWTIYKRVLAQNLLRASFDENYTVQDAARNSFAVSSWITEGVLMSATSKAVTAPLKAAAVSRFSTMRPTNTIPALKAGIETAYASHADKLLRMQGVRKQYPTLNFVTGEIEDTRSWASRMGDVSRTAQLTMMRPTSDAQLFARGVVKGGAGQYAGAEIFTGLIGHPRLARLAWSTKFIQNLDELYLPPGSMSSDYSKAYMLLRAFDVSTVRKNTFGNYSRLNRIQLARGAAGSVGNMQHLETFARNTFTPEGLGRLTGSLAVRQLMIATGQDEKIREAYARANRQKADKTRGRGVVYVEGYYRNGHHVKAHERGPRGS